MSALFDLVGEYKELYAMLTEDADDEVIQDTLEGVAGEIEVKSEGYVAIINRLDMEIDACKKQRDMWVHNLKVRENAMNRLKTRLSEAMVQLGKDEIKAGANTIKLTNNGGQLPIMYTADVPKEYIKTTIVEEKDTEKIRQALNEGKDLGFAKFGERGKHIRIK